MVSNISKELLLVVVVFAIGVTILTFAKDIRLQNDYENDLPVPPSVPPHTHSDSHTHLT